MWFGTDGGGVSRMKRDASVLSTLSALRAPRSRFTSFTMADGLEQQYRWPELRRMPKARCGSLAGPKRHWNAGLSRYDGKSFVNFSRTDGLVGARVLWCSSRSNTAGLWATTTFGVSHYDYRSVTILGEADGPGHWSRLEDRIDIGRQRLVPSRRRSSETFAFDGAKLVKADARTMVCRARDPPPFTSIAMVRCWFPIWKPRGPSPGSIRLQLRASASDLN
jgi:hypothetical protein